MLFFSVVRPLSACILFMTDSTTPLHNETYLTSLLSSPLAKSSNIACTTTLIRPSNIQYIQIPTRWNIELEEWVADRGVVDLISGGVGEAERRGVPGELEWMRSGVRGILKQGL